MTALRTRVAVFGLCSVGAMTEPDPLVSIEREITVGTLNGLADEAKRQIKSHRAVLDKLHVRVPDNFDVPEPELSGDADVDESAARLAFVSAYRDHLEKHSAYWLEVKARRKAREQRAALGLSRFAPGGRFTLDAMMEANARGRALKQSTMTNAERISA